MSKFKHVLEPKKVNKPKAHISEDSQKDGQLTKGSISRFMALLKTSHFIVSITRDMDTKIQEEIYSVNSKLCYGFCRPFDNY